MWWFPQGQPFDAENIIKEKLLPILCAAMEQKLPNCRAGAVITFERLSSADVVIKVPSFFSYTANEVMAYRESVAAGTRLILIGGSTRNNDPVAEIFGLSFEKRTHFAPVKRWNQHPFTTSIDECCEHLWSSIAEVPKEAVLLAWLSRDKQTPVFDYLPFGRGYVAFVGQTLFFRHPNSSFSKNLVNSIGRFSLDETKQVPPTGVIDAEESLRMTPHLIEPLNNSTFPQIGAGEWRFDWEDIPDAENYEIVIQGPSTSIPLVHATFNKSEYTFRSQKTEDKAEVQNGGYIVGDNLRG